MKGLQDNNKLLSTGIKRKISAENENDNSSTDDCLRFKINLFKSTEKTYPEIDINELIKSKRKITDSATDSAQKLLKTYKRAE